MVMILIQILFCSSFITRTISIYLGGTTTIHPPQTTKHPTPYYDVWAEHTMANHLLNMTSELIYDLSYKLEQANTIQNSYKSSLGYELGYMAAGIMDKFKYMLEIYQTYCNIHDFENKKHEVVELLDGYHVIQGEYNDVKQHVRMFNEMLEKFKLIRNTRNEIFEQLSKHCLAYKKKFRIVPIEVLRDTPNLIHNLKVYKAVKNCTDDAQATRAVSKVQWPQTRRLNSDYWRRNPKENSKTDNFKSVKWSGKGEPFKAIEDIDIEFT